MGMGMRTGMRTGILMRAVKRGGWIAAAVLAAAIAGGTLLGTMGVTTGTVSAKEQHYPGSEMDLAKATEWVNTKKLSSKDLKGKVVLVDFWAFDCGNCQNTLPHVESWWAKYKDQGFVVIGVHTPELAEERDPANVKRAVTKLGITYPVAIDTNMDIWNSFRNEAWPAEYLFDANGKVVAFHEGEGDYDGMEATIQKLLAERGKQS
jgi:thiol-disulfide isomerase/thioredoxin